VVLHGLFYNNATKYTMLMLGCLVNNKFKMIWKKPHTVAMRHYPNICLDRLKKPRKNFNPALWSL